MKTESTTLDALTDIEFLDFIIRQFCSRPSLQLVVGVVRDRKGEVAFLYTGGEPNPKELRAIANELESKGIGWTQLVKQPD
jgi:hypothetical protein